jgi:hypothetical protein
MGTGTFTNVVNAVGNGSIRTYVFSWTSTAGGAAASDPIPNINGFVVALETNPGATAPTDNYDITVTNEDGFDVLLGVGANRDLTDSEMVFPLSAALPVMVPVNGSLTFNVTNAGATKDGVAKLHVLVGKE